jgi:hypothetical protein
MWICLMGSFLGGRGIFKFRDLFFLLCGMRYGFTGLGKKDIWHGKCTRRYGIASGAFWACSGRIRGICM